ncbi:MAG: pilus assembly FimT family protein [Sporichthyaceae bacterium]
MKARARDAGLSLIEILVVLAILGTVSVLFMGVGAVSFGKQAESGSKLIDSAQRIALQSRLQADLRDSAATGTTGFPCTPAAPGVAVLWTQASLLDPVQNTEPGDVIVYYTAETTSRSGTAYTSLRRTQCLRDGQTFGAVAPAGEEMARWTGTGAQVVVRCNFREPGNGCGGGGRLTQELPSDVDAIAAFPGTPTTGPASIPDYSDPTAERVRIGEETAVFIGGWGGDQLELARPNRAASAWPVDTVVVYSPSVFDVCVPLKGIACGELGAGELRLTVTRRLT